jgi:hypothetical protein
VEGHSSLGSPHSPVQEASVRGALEVGVTRSRIRNPTSCCIGGEGEPPRAQEALAIPLSLLFLLRAEAEFTGII